MLKLIYNAIKQHGSSLNQTINSNSLRSKWIQKLPANNNGIVINTKWKRRSIPQQETETGIEYLQFWILCFIQKINDAGRFMFCVKTK